MHSLDFVITIVILLLIITFHSDDKPGVEDLVQGKVIPQLTIHFHQTYTQDGKSQKGTTMRSIVIVQSKGQETINRSQNNRQFT